MFWMSFHIFSTKHIHCITIFRFGEETDRIRDCSVRPHRVGAVVERSSNNGLLEAVMVWPVEEEEVTQETLDRVTLFTIWNGVNLTKVSCIEVP